MNEWMQNGEPRTDSHKASELERETKRGREGERETAGEEKKMSEEQITDWKIIKICNNIRQKVNKNASKNVFARVKCAPAGRQSVPFRFVILMLMVPMPVSAFYSIKCHKRHAQ